MRNEMKKMIYLLIFFESLIDLNLILIWQNIYEFFTYSIFDSFSSLLCISIDNWPYDPFHYLFFFYSGSPDMIISRVVVLHRALGATWAQHHWMIAKFSFECCLHLSASRCITLHQASSFWNQLSGADARSEYSSVPW